MVTRAKMSRGPRRAHSTAVEARVALAAVRGGKALAELAWQDDVHPSHIIDWTNQFLSRAADVSGGDAAATEPAVDLNFLLSVKR